MVPSEDNGPLLRLCFVGDELIAGTGDPRAQGWVGRVLAQIDNYHDRMVAILPVHHESTLALSLRWETECRQRFTPRTDNRLIVGLGVQDLREGISLARARLNLAKILDAAATARHAAFVVGPPPLPGVDPGKLSEYSEAFHEVSRRRSVPYAETFEHLYQHEQWRSDVAASPSGLPGHVGYELITWLVMHYGFKEWLCGAAN